MAVVSYLPLIETTIFNPEPMLPQKILCFKDLLDIFCIFCSIFYYNKAESCYF